MWLINTTTMRLEPVPDPAGYQYAVLSHTWRRAGEPTFQDMLKRTERDEAKFVKIRETCRLAKARGIPYAWVDTCCIDKTSSAELTEAINSMFRWYREAAVCFAYLDDFQPDHTTKDLDRSNWFRRGWTLQELIAPKTLEIYDATWLLRGDKTSMKGVLSDITNVDEEVLENSMLLPTISIARRMSWASKRQTTRVEDMAYCLFGIFDVYLPLIYGEGERAFLRLQEAIVQESNDMSLFAWTSSEKSQYQEYWGVFARSPAYFQSCDQIYQLDNPSYPPNDFTVTNRGVHLYGRIHDSQTRSGEQDTLLDLECVDKSRQQADGSHNLVFIRLLPVLNGYIRHCCQGHAYSSLAHMGSSRNAAIYIPKALSDAESHSLRRRLSQLFFVSVQTATSLELEASDGCHKPDHLWQPLKHCFMTDGSPHFVAIFDLSISGGKYDTSLQSSYNEHSTKVAVFGPPQYKIRWPEIFVVLGFSPERESDSYHTSQDRTAGVRPWVAIYHKNEDAEIGKIRGQQDRYGVGHVFDRIGALMRMRLKASQQLQTHLIATPELTRSEYSMSSDFKVIQALPENCVKISSSIDILPRGDLISHKLQIRIEPFQSG